jgi:hypothetical protein
MGDGVSRRVLIAAAAAASWSALAKFSTEASAQGQANDAAARRRPEASADAPFAEHHLALQLSDRDPGKQALVLSVANNVLKFYGPDLVDIEVVAFGPGIDLLRAESANRRAVDSLIAQGVRFAICMNTIDTIARETGETPAINDKAIPVVAGVVELLKLAEAGYTVVRP